ncbi:hypothetical protein K440DRAFT_679928 [Wilcoxina mikolae CBS 423.85]|nr:hypothetical protein K440DRAFT_679928 [Wilcoxina mikolae CBS 423.85]
MWFGGITMARLRSLFVAHTLVPCCCSVWGTLASTSLGDSLSLDGNSNTEFRLTATRSNETEIMGNTSANETSPAPSPMNTQACNQYLEYCNRSYGNITYVGAHNSPFVRQNNAASNQRLEVTTQLNDGIRMRQTHKVNDTLYYCHTSCNLLNAGTVEDYLKTVVDWMRPWSSSITRPTKRRFLYLLDQFTYMWETPFSQTDADFPCNIDRPLDETGGERKLYMANHNLVFLLSLLSRSSLTLPERRIFDLRKACSGFSSLGLQANSCYAMWGRYLNFLLVDFYDSGNGSVFVAAKVNNVTYRGGHYYGKVKSFAAGPPLVNPIILLAEFLFFLAFFALG